MECNAARKILDVSLAPGNDAPDVREALQHLQNCPACAESVRSRRVFDDQIAAVMRDVEVPRDLKQRILAAVAPTVASLVSISAPPVRRRMRTSRIAACVATISIVASVGAYVAWRRRPQKFDLAAIQRTAAEILQHAGNRIDLSQLQKFSGSFDLAALKDWSKGIDLRGIDIDGRSGQDAAAAVVRIGRRPQATAILLIIPARRVLGGNHLASRAGVAYAPVPNAAWRSGDFVFVCFTTSQNREDLEHYAMSVPA